MTVNRISPPVLVVSCAILTLVSACGSSLEVFNWPIEFDDERIRLSQAYAREHYGVNAPDIEIEPRVIVLHWTEYGTLAESFEAFNPVRLPERRGDIASAGDVNVSIHFLVDRDGTVYQLMPETWMARHCIGLNYVSIGVENVGGEGGRDDLTDAQIRANAELVRELKKRHPSIEFLIGHYENEQFVGHPLWMERDDGYRTEKVDPGERFMTAVRARVEGLGLRQPPRFEY